MFRNRLTMLSFMVVTLLAASNVPTRAQEDKGDLEAITRKKTIELLEKANEEYRVFFKKPDTAIEFWAAIKFEMDLGKFDLAALHLKLMLAKEPAADVDKDLVKLEQAEGMSAFFRLQRVRPESWSDHPPFRKEAVENIDKLIDRVTKAVEAHLSNEKHIRKFIGRLTAATEEERAYAYVQIARSRERAVPYLIDELRVSHDKPIFPALREVMLRMGPETVPVYLEIFKARNDQDYRDHLLRITLLDIIKKRDDPRVVPYLWHMSASKKYPDAVRAKAKETLASLLRVNINEVPPARESLTLLAERYYQHQVPLKQDEPVLIYRWNGVEVAKTPDKLSPYDAEEFFGLRYAREALDLDAGYQPAQTVLLSLTLERYYKPEIEQVLLKPMPPKLHELLTTIDPDLMARVLERGMSDRQLPVILPVLQALGERGEFRAARPGTNGQPGGVVQALYYPDRRVQFAAMKAMLKMPRSSSPAVASERIVDLSRRYLASAMNPKAIVAHAPIGQEPAVRQLVKAVGYEPIIARKTSEAVDAAKKTADVDLLILHRGMNDEDFPAAFAQLRKQHDAATVPMLILAAKGRERIIQKHVARDSGVLVLSEEKFVAGDDLKNLIEAHIKKVAFAKLTPEERKEFASASMDTLWRMARGELEGYNVLPALDVLMEQVSSKDYALIAIETIGKLPGKEVQVRLTGIVADPAGDMKLRVPALLELNRHIHKNGVLIEKAQQTKLRDAHAAAQEGSVFRTQLTLTMSSLARMSVRQTGADLLKFRPDPPPAPKEKEEKKAN